MKSKWRTVIDFILVITVLLLVTPIIGSTADLNSDSDEVETNEADDIDMIEIDSESGLVLGAENDNLALFFDNETGGIAVEDKSSGHIFYSNPRDAMDDPKASSEQVKQELMSQIELVYNIKGTESDVAINSYSQAMLLEQISWGKLDNGIRVTMTIGREDQRLLLPMMIGKSSFEENILSKIESERERKQMEAFYILNLKEDMPDATEDIYTLKTSANDRDRRVLEEIVQKTGYTYEMLEDDHEAAGYSASEHAFPSFGLDIEYILENDSLSVNINVDEIRYDEDIFNLVSLSPLKFFGAAKTGEQGYIFLPDGSGTLIGFNNHGDKKELLSSGKVYGDDNALTLYKGESLRQDFRYPVFGIIKEEVTIMGIIDEGDAIADINGVMGDINHSWNTAYASFTIKNKDTFIEEGAFEAAPWVVYEDRPYSGNINIRYYFLSGDESNYVGMANTYRRHLINNGTLEKLEPSASIPFYMETIGSVDMIVRKLGIPMSTQVPITTFEQAAEMVTDLSDAGVDNIKVRYKGWYNGGLYYTAPTKMKVEKVLGGSRGLKELAKNLQEMEVELYPDIDFVYVPASSTFDRFSPSKDSIRNLFQKLAFGSELDLPSLRHENTQWVISPNRIPQYFDKFSKSFNKLDIPNMSLSTMGENISSNFKNNNQVNRQESKDYIAKTLKSASDKYEGIISDYGNAYILPYTNHILNLPEEDSSLLVSDKQVPFMQIALHGYVSYAGQPINMATEIKTTMLKAIEYGSSAYFVMNYGDDGILKSARVNDIRGSMVFSYWRDKAVEIYLTMNEALKDVQDKEIINHKELENQVFKTTYEGGISIIVNYNEESVNVEGVTIEPLDFMVIGK